MIKDILVKLAVGTERDPARDYALSIAEAFDAHLVGMALAYEHPLPGFVFGQVPAELVAPALRAYRQEVEAAVERFVAAVKRSQVSAEQVVQKALEHEAPQLVASGARRFDLSVIMQSQPDGPNNDRLIAGLLFDSGRPVVLVPYIQRDGFKLDRVICCWDGSRPAARAINDALPLLTRAGIVDVFIVLNEKTRNEHREIRGVRMAQHLARHNIKAEVNTSVAPDMDVASTILSYAADSTATMVVMGAYGHARARELILGGATRGVLASMTVPVLMSH